MAFSSTTLLVLLLAGQQVPAAAPADPGSAAPAGAPALVLTPLLPLNSTTTEPPPVPPSAASFTLDTPIRALIADPRAKAVLDRDLPGLSEDANLAKFEMLGLRALQPRTGGQLTNALLAKAGEDLAAMTAAPAAAAQPPVTEPAKPVAGRNGDVGR